MEQTQLLARALDQLADVAGAVKPDQLGDATPCSEFDVRALLNHTVASLQFFTASAQGDDFDFESYGRDLLGDDPNGAFDRAVDGLRAVTKDASVVEKQWRMPSGDSPGEQAITIAIIESVQHAWDLAHAAGSTSGLDEELGTAALGLAQKYMPPDDKRTPDMFGPSVKVADSAPAPDRLAAFLGRTP